MSAYQSTVLTAALTAMLFPGCSGGDGGSRTSVYPVTGKITMSGAPVANAVVTFSPKDKQPVAMGRTDTNGVYKLTTYDANDGAAEGDYTVLVSKSAPAASASGPPAHSVTATASPVGAHTPRKKGAAGTASDSVLPEKYGDRGKSDLQAPVKANGENKFDFDLKP